MAGTLGRNRRERKMLDQEALGLGKYYNDHFTKWEVLEDRPHQSPAKAEVRGWSHLDPVEAEGDDVSALDHLETHDHLTRCGAAWEQTFTFYINYSEKLIVDNSYLACPGVPCVCRGPRKHKPPSWRNQLKLEAFYQLCSSYLCTSSSRRISWVSWTAKL